MGSTPQPRARTEVPGPPRSPDPDPAALTFPDVPRLELDQLLEQLVDRAQEVLTTQGRLRGLLRANRLVAGDLALPVVLRRIVSAARELVGARYAALGVIGPSGLVEFVHEGMPPDALARIGHLPQGKGLLGALIDQPEPIRIPHVRDDPRSVGFPAGHPGMESFLGVPIRVRGDVFGNVYVADSTRGTFSAEDEELLAALAVSAGGAIDNARLYETARARGEWLQASAAATRELLSPGADDGRALALIAERTQEIADADLALLMVPDGPDGSQLRIAVSVGEDGGHLRGRTLPVATSLSGRVLTTGEPVAVPRLTDEGGLAALTSGRVDVGPVLAVPLTGSGRVHGVLTVGRLAGRPAFTTDDVDMVFSFANHAALAIELAEARREQERASVLGDRERIAADLHDHVIQRLFAAGLSLQALAATMGPGAAADRLATTIRDLDDTIGQIRASIFQLQEGARAQSAGLRTRVLAVVDEVVPALGFEPALRFDGLLDALVPDAVADDAVAVVREALTNVARHARARSARVELTLADGALTVVVRDDGRGLGPTSRRSGLANMRRRAQGHGGDLVVAPAVGGGTVVTWRGPTRA
ncbi:GAF domain-containing protein [Modestobacter sp. NPDC049651]|uniref:GAF domain-containing sensor histidine kinase n=1 Tax=Modestobacter sp. NPDC049651 TaxID=3155777 RepID=UPI0033F095EC